MLSAATGDDAADRWSGAAQLASMAIAVGVGRFVLRSRATIWLVAFLGTVGAMFAHIAVDGQGAFVIVLATPILYFLAVAGRDLDSRWPRPR